MKNIKIVDLIRENEVQGSISLEVLEDGLQVYTASTKEITVGFSTYLSAVKYVSDYNYITTRAEIEEIKRNKDFQIVRIGTLEKFNSLFLYVNYKVSDNYMENNGLCNKERQRIILINPDKNFQGSALSDYALVR